MNKFLLAVVFSTCIASMFAAKTVYRIPVSELSPEEIQMINNANFKTSSVKFPYSSGGSRYADDYGAGVRKLSPYKNAELSRQLSLDAVARNTEYEGMKDKYDEYIQKAQQAYEVRKKNKQDGLFDMDADLSNASNPYDLYDLLDKLQVKYDSSRLDLQKKLEKDGLTPDEQKAKLQELEKSYDTQKSTVEEKLKKMVEETAQNMNLNSAELLESYKKGYENLYKSENDIEFNKKLMSATSIVEKMTLLNELEKNLNKNMSALQDNLEKAIKSGDNDSVKNIKNQQQKLLNEYASQSKAVKNKLNKPSYDQYSYNTRNDDNYNSYEDTRYQPYQRPYSAYNEDRYYRDQYNRLPSGRYYY